LTPVAGKIVEANSVLEDTPGLLNRDPEGEGWIAKLEVKNAEEIFEKLMDGEGYKKFTEESS
jgi:glycine cleavage system H protein